MVSEELGYCFHVCVDAAAVIEHRGRAGCGQVRESLLAPFLWEWRKNNENLDFPDR